jgi:hypothetical protein
MSYHDPDAQKVYEWEGKWVHWQINEFGKKLDTARIWVAKSCEAYGVKKVPVRLAKNSDDSYFDLGKNAIYLLRQHNNIAVSLHESAHAICYDLFGLNVHDHGPEFAGIYIWLLADAGIAPVEALTASADACGVEYISIDKADPKNIRKSLKNKLLPSK